MGGTDLNLVAHGDNVAGGLAHGNGADGPLVHVQRADVAAAHRVPHNGRAVLAAAHLQGYGGGTHTTRYIYLQYLCRD